MEQTEGKDLFDIKLTTSGKTYIRKFAGVVRVAIFIGIIISLIYLTWAVIRTSRITSIVFEGDKLLRFQYKILPVYTAVHSILFFFQIYYYWKVSRYLSKGIGYNDEVTFNRSFMALYRNAVFGIITLILSLTMALFELYFEIKYYVN